MNLPSHTSAASYADQFGRQYASRSVSSSLGLWVLLAAAGVRGEDEQRAAAELLADQPEGLKMALALWSAIETPALREFVSSLPAQAATGKVPSQAEADRWVAENTDGMLTQHPSLAKAVLVLSSTIMAKTQWPRPLSVVTTSGLPGWFSGVRGALLVGEHRWASVQVHDTDSAGRVVAAVIEGVNGVVVVSVLGEPEVEPEALGRAAREIATNPEESRVDFGTLSEGDHGLFTVQTMGGGKDAAWAYLPCWEVNDSFDVTEAPGVPELVAKLHELAGSELPVDGTQLAVARFDQYGFEAAAVTSMTMRSGHFSQRRSRVVKANFDRPFAVHATYSGNGPWDGMPLFDAWITEIVSPRRDEER
ncbi:MAG: hypothetical protein V9F04_13740 [Dermatophilaceae bacterium]